MATHSWSTFAGFLKGPIVWAPGVNGAVVVSLRGGDFCLDCGQDLSIGYDSHDAEVVTLYLVESISSSTWPRPRRQWR